MVRRCKANRFLLFIMGTEKVACRIGTGRVGLTKEARSAPPGGTDGVRRLKKVYKKVVAAAKHLHPNKMHT
jgi:hypothetical protein